MVFRGLSGEISMLVDCCVRYRFGLIFLKYTDVGVKWLLRVWTNEVNNSVTGEGCLSCAWV